MSTEVKQFISYKDIKHGIVVNGFLDEKSFCGTFEVRLSTGQKISKSGVFSRVHTFTRENFVMDFTKYLEQ
jgi:hypothetical protein